jgi:tetratricopeptide (TPR) repeat protein
MKLKLVILPIILLTGCLSKKSNDCKYYNEGVEYFNNHYHVDYMDNGSLEEAVRIFEKAVNSGCNNYDLFYKLYFCYESSGDNRNAEKYISKAIEVDPSKSPELYYWRGELNIKLKRLKEAIADYTVYVKSNHVRDISTGYYRLGGLQYALGDTINSKINMERAIELDGGKEKPCFDDFVKTWDLNK